MKSVLLTLAIITLSGSLLSSDPTYAQLATPAKRAGHVQISQGPELELVRNNWAIVRWTSNNPGGTDDHWAVLHYGTDPQNLNRMAKSHIRLNQTHPDTIFRVRVLGLNPGTTYYYRVDSMEATGQSDGMKSPVKSFTTLSSDQAMAISPPAARSTAKMRPSIQ
jgi:phosphodiesterase/alkaline phosphatase D-like protein